MDLVRRAANFSYMDDGAFVFMDAEDYTQYLLSPELIGDNAGYIVEGIEGYYVQVIDEAPVGLQVPSSVILRMSCSASGVQRTRFSWSGRSTTPLVRAAVLAGSRDAAWGLGAILPVVAWVAWVLA